MKTMKNHNLLEELFKEFFLQSWALHRIRAFCWSASGLAASWTVDLRCVEELHTTLDAGVKTWHKKNTKKHVSKLFNIHLGRSLDSELHESFGRILAGFPLFLYGKLVTGFLPSLWPHPLEAPSLASRRNPRRGDRPTPKLRRQNPALQGPCNVWATLVIIGTVN